MTTKQALAAFKSRTSSSLYSRIMKSINEFLKQELKKYLLFANCNENIKITNNAKTQLMLLYKKFKKNNKIHGHIDIINNKKLKVKTSKITKKDLKIIREYLFRNRGKKKLKHNIVNPSIVYIKNNEYTGVFFKNKIIHIDFKFKKPHGKKHKYQTLTYKAAKCADIYMMPDCFFKANSNNITYIHRDSPWITMHLSKSKIIMYDNNTTKTNIDFVNNEINFYDKSIGSILYDKYTLGFIQLPKSLIKPNKFINIIVSYGEVNQIIKTIKSKKSGKILFKKMIFNDNGKIKSTTYSDLNFHPVKAQKV